ncbi:hypothetical protein BDW59DRAFT_54749 [Aspergillus cavernicola]|uniref:BZIP domain-containing protein n=1 Tax=Aspergillus cavernicola TaxID=176166 RepID=A0ABR4IJ80_9EURO
MSAQAAFYPDPPMEPAVSPRSLLLGNGFGSDFLSLALLEKEPHQPAMTIPPSMSFPSSNDMPPTQAVTPMTDTIDSKPSLRNRHIRPAPIDNRKHSLDIEPPYQHTYPSISSSTFSSFSTSNSNSNSISISQDPADFPFNHSPNSDLSSPKSPSPLHNWPPHDKAQKREKHLERNRAAASKSRQKKKRETDLLKSRYQDVSRKRRLLEEEIKGLHHNLLFLKDQILMHSQCEDESIRLYLGQMVKQATHHESISSAGDAEDWGQGRDSISPERERIAFHPHEMALGMEDPDGAASGLPCGAEKPMMNQMISAGNIFDYQISI